MDIKQFIKVNENEWLIPVDTQKQMRVPVRLFASHNLLVNALKDRSIEQAINAASLPGLVDEVKVMPDMHQGYGFPIGGVAATRYLDGVISPGGIGYDINCGVRLLSSKIYYDEIKQYLPDLADAIFRTCPSGVGKKGNVPLSKKIYFKFYKSAHHGFPGGGWLKKAI